LLLRLQQTIIDYAIRGVLIFTEGRYKIKNIPSATIKCERKKRQREGEINQLNTLEVNLPTAIAIYIIVACKLLKIIL